MRAGCVVHYKFNDVKQFTGFVGKTPEDIANKHAHDFLSFFVLIFYKSLFHGTPCCAETVANACQCCIFLQKCILKLDSSVCPQQHRNGPTAEHALRKCAADF